MQNLVKNKNLFTSERDVRVYKFFNAIYSTEVNFCHARSTKSTDNKRIQGCFIERLANQLNKGCFLI